MDDPQTMNDVFDLYEKECLPDVTAKVAYDYRGMMKYLRHAFGHLHPKEVTPKHVVAFHREPNRGKVQRNRLVMLLSMVFKRSMGSWCIDLNLANPCIPVQRNKTSPRERYITDAEFHAFRATVNTKVQIAMDLALLIGQRQGDIIGLKWAQLHDKEIWIDQGKTGKKLAIEISPAVEAVLDRAWLLPPVFPHTYVIPTKFGRRYTGDGFRAMWQHYMRKWMAAGNENFHFHDIRAKSISDNPVFENAYLLAGHIDQSITRGTYDRNRRKVMPLR